MEHRKGKCPDYVEYSKFPHPPYSSGDHEFPFMRPALGCRTFSSPAVEKLVEDLKTKLVDKDLSRMVENCLPNTLDTTILHHTPGNSPSAFVVTGDIHAEWLRDAARQLSVYQPLIKHDNALKTLILGAINTQVEYVMVSPYCNAFHPPPNVKVKRGNTAHDEVFPVPNWRWVFECKYEIDSLALFLTLTNEYYENLGDTSFLTEAWLSAFQKVLIVLRRESVLTYDEETGQALQPQFMFKRNTNIGLETLPLNGAGNPVNSGTGLIRSAFRPSDDATILQFFIPGNIHMLTELRKLRRLFLTDEVLGSKIMIQTTDAIIAALERGIEEHGVVTHPKYGRVYAYEVDGYGGSVFMDDANIPSLLSIPDLGYKPIDDEVYQNTRRMVLDRRSNPYYLEGRHFAGIGGPHIGVQNAWPMSLLMMIRTTDDDDEIIRNLEVLKDTTAGLGLMHESVHVNLPNGRDYTRSWFAWCNSEFGKTILDLAQRKPELLFGKGARPYNLDSLFEKREEV